VLAELIFGKKINVLLLFIPLAYSSYQCNWDATYVFWLNFFALIPLAAMLGDLTEEIANHTNDLVGGLINCTMGNIVEVVVAFQALSADQVQIVQGSMLGSIFSNLLLVLGLCFCVGGMKQDFNPTAAIANTSLLALSAMAIAMPTPFAASYQLTDVDANVLAMSRAAAVILFFMYVQLIIFQLITHKHLFENDDESEKPQLPLSVAIIALLVVTGTLSILSEYLVASIDSFCSSSGLSKSFVGIIILPIVGNAVEHVAAVSVAMKGKMDLAMGGNVYISKCF